MPGFVRFLLLAAVLACGTTACQRETPDPQPAPASRPIDAVQIPARHLRHNDLVGFARDALPPALHARVEAAWRDGTGRWPLHELPLHEQLPKLIATLAEDGSEARLRQDFQRQFSASEGELRRAIETLGLFGVHYTQNDRSLDEHQREHRIQLIEALARWALQAPLSDPARAAEAIDRLASAARATGLAPETAFAEAGMENGLGRLSPMLETAKQILAGYGLDIDAALDGTEATLERQTGDRARVRVRYRLANQPIDTLVEVERHDGRWYRSDYLRRAEAAAPRAPPRAPHPDGS